MTIKEYRQNFITELEPIIGRDESESFFYISLEHIHNMRRIDLALDPTAEISEVQKNRWDDILEKLKQELPIQYITGVADFYGMKFRVSPSVLIPRPETEELVEWIIKDSPNQSSKILDIGTGSGCIAISLAKNLNAKVFATDVSPEALEIAKANSELNNAPVNFLKQDILSTEALDSKYDIIVSNPPYVRELEKHEIKKNVLESEPHLALFVADNDALVFYRKIAQLAMQSLTPNGKLYFEINQYLAKETMDLLEAIGFNQLELRRDIYGNHRMIRAIRT